MIAVPAYGNSGLDDNIATTSAEFGTTVTGDSTIHTKGAWAELTASLATDVYGITILIAGTGATASQNNRALVDIGIGAASSEVVLIPDLLCGNTPQIVSAMGYAAMYHFPIAIARGTRVAARLQGLIASETATVAVWYHTSPTGPGGWYGSRVTAYGPSAATSSGVSHTNGNSSYATATQIVAACDNPIRYLQVGMDLGTATAGTTSRGLLRIGIGATPTYIASDLPYSESTTLETVNFSLANAVLSSMRFNIPAGTRLAVSAMRNATGAARGFALYGVD